MSSKPKLNPKAAAFQFRPGAASFVPGGAAAAPAPAAAPKPEPVVAAKPEPVVAKPAEQKEVAERWDDEPKAAPKAEPKAEPKPVVAAPPAAAPVANKKNVDEVEAGLEAEIARLELEEAAAAAKPKPEMKAHDPREHINIVFIGHVDAGKSTLSGQIMLLTGQVDARTIEKYEKEAKEKNRESWYLAYIMDTNEEERAKGKTVEVGRAHFTTPTKRYTLLDAPGHKNYVPNMIGGAAQADVGVLVISARKGEFETGFDRGGQTREHAMLAKTLGIQRLIVLVNKMDDKTVEWAQSRFDEIQAKLNPFLKKWGFAIKRDVIYCPVSGFTGANMKDVVDPKVCPWYKGESFMTILDSLKPIQRDVAGPVRLPVIARYKDMGVVCVLGKLESGTIEIGQELRMMPVDRRATVVGLLIDEDEVNGAKAGENVVVKLKGLEEEEVMVGFVFCDAVKPPTKKSKKFEAQIAVLELLEHKPLVTAGYQGILHVHTLEIECEIETLISELDRKTGKMTKRPPRFIKSGGVATVHITVPETMAVEPFKDTPQMGRFTLRDEGKTIAVGKINEVFDVRDEAAK